MTLRGSVVALAVLARVLHTTETHASAIFDGLATATGAGVGTSNVVLTIQMTPTESGCVAWNGTTDVVGAGACSGGLSPAISGGDEKTGASQTQTRTVSQTGVQS